MQGDNARIQLTLDGPDKDAFSVTPASANSESIVQILVKNPQIVDYETKTSMVVQVSMCEGMVGVFNSD